MGELGLFYRLAPFCFLGGTLVPLGGHNPLEPARAALRGAGGPAHRQRAHAPMRRSAARKALAQVTSSADIAREAARLLADPEAARGGGRCGGARRGHPCAARWTRTVAQLEGSCSMRAPDFWRQRELRPPCCWRRWARSMALSVALKARYARPFDPGLPVICVGNLTAGGSGKTPIAIAIADMLRATRPQALLSSPAAMAAANAARRWPRAPTARRMMGDEALLLARAAPTIVARDRAAGARLAKEKGATVLVMDDGHQNFCSAQKPVAGGGGCRDRLRQRLSDSGRSLARAGGARPGPRRCGGA